MRFSSYIILGLAVFVIIVAGAACNRTPSTQIESPISFVENNSDTLATTNTTGEVEDENNQTVAGVTISKAPVTNIGSPSTYAKTVTQFSSSGYRYQFANCSGLPGKFTVKKGVQFMLDNRDAERHTMRLADRSYSIPAYGYALVTINTAGTYQITCDGGGSAQVQVQN
ncbi:MAG: hypothetical protein A3D53_03535 [Candidatus Magasanikbacteria bacterium RIFCSPHIGHO2_02_FULL_45_10]|uniref:Uncharacterized protein n=1 Tax=Candidatus Magasanikbacteria bacterium RIFCSPHIGHO2_02_FULL_45_10 TaxID=1798679 RepID=A0A1F6M9U2_9BACT|nr:MAG: hypothetical protein A3D53_03535 [Candidatus Magasanikbacteria bacterium RIFCSPHIGHO2_02_FULL_45_10]